MSPILSEWYKARDFVAEFVENELAGPGLKNNLESAPLNEIIVGVLYPQVSDNADLLAPSDALRAEPFELKPGHSSDTTEYGSDADDATSSSYSRKPSSMGLSFTVSPDTGTRTIVVSVSAIHYQKMESNWQPKLVEFTTEPIEILSSARGKTIGIAEGLNLKVTVRPPQSGGIRITITLVNTHVASPGDLDEFCWFRPSLVVRTTRGYFIEGVSKSRRKVEDPDVLAAQFLYRHTQHLAVGHGCAVTWDEDKPECNELRTEFFPRQEVYSSDPQSGYPGDPYGEYDLSMAVVADVSGYRELDALADAYELWITSMGNNLKSERMELSRDLYEQGLLNVQNARKSLERIRRGIQLLRDDHDVAFAFRLTNEAMASQQKRLDDSLVPTWRPFQIAFILLNLPGLSGDNLEDREIADLLWFPTGGGKTEAYLGCISFSILFRRIKNPSDGGVSAIMRYTLRLLTTDQFSRAASLTCALELTRQESLPGSTPISLGLWVGGSTTPNLLKDAENALSNAKRGREPSDGSTPVQLRRCPWCDHELNESDYHIRDNALKICCRASECPFKEGLPVAVVDEDVYAMRPSLLIGTVDKFAQMTWKASVSQLFSMDGKYSSPDLIVQDELHLITGPLGTMVGLYESALDIAFTEQNGRRPKILASTATIRRADEQVKAVFDRKPAQFPPPGLSPDDNYFSRSAGRMEKGTREYFGVFAPGQSQATQIIWLYSALLQAVKELDADPEIIDAYYTLLGYFNSLRVLGSTYIQTVDDIPKKVDSIAKTRGSDGRDLSTQEPLELTSRVASTLIPGIREQMGESYPSPSTPNIVLATNMISVGLDIPRLGLMVIAGQPQNTSEYIQASSRVGRRNPGLVFVSFNSNKARDVSHFESFVPFHRSLYQAVESTTVTPFSSRARDRGAHGVLVAAARMLVDGLREDNAPSAITEEAPAVLDKVIPLLVERAKRISPAEAAVFEKQLVDLVSEWEQAAKSGLLEKYGSMAQQQSSDVRNKSLLEPASPELGAASFGSDKFEIPWGTLTSLRNVDSETEFILARERKRTR